MEVIRDIKIKLQIKTDKRTIEKEFSNLFDVKVFMENFFSFHSVPDRRAKTSSLGYVGPERRMRKSYARKQVGTRAMGKDPGQT